jgi:hypothetical protein
MEIFWLPSLQPHLILHPECEANHTGNGYDGTRIGSPEAASAPPPRAKIILESSWQPLAVLHF